MFDWPESPKETDGPAVRPSPLLSPKHCFHLVGIGGIGMSAIAQHLLKRGYRVQGSDRKFEQGEDRELLADFIRMGIGVFPQDGAVLRKGRVGTVVSSSAVENANPDVSEARRLGIPVLSRAQLLADIFHRFPTRIAIAGTSGKTTITAMVTTILAEAGRDPTAIIGGYVRALCSEHLPGNYRPGGSQCVCIEADESDGTIELYRPTVGLVSNIALDHRPLAELKPLFADFLLRSTGALVFNRDCPVLRELAGELSQYRGNLIDFGISNEACVRPRAIRWLDGAVHFALDGTIFELNVRGVYNLSNALAAIAVCRAAGVPDEDIARGLSRFTGVARRMEHIASVADIDVYDDFAHNPHKLGAAIQSLAQRHSRLLLVFQFHGFGPARLMRKELVAVLTEVLRPCDMFLLPEIYYAGGTVVRDISARDIAEDIRRAGRLALFMSNREDIPHFIADNAVAGDGVAVMGARDPTLPLLARSVARALSAVHEASSEPRAAMKA